MPAVVWPFTDTESNVPTSADFDVATFMPRFCATQAPKVAFIGDSTTLRSGNNAFYDDNLVGVLMSRLREDNPGKTITFGNYAIGGSTFFNFNQTGTTLLGNGFTLPSWFSPTSSTWISFVQSFAPDVIFINFGVNDAYTLSTSTIITHLTSICGWTKVPDIVFITPKGAATNATQAWYDGRLNGAALIRTISQSNGLGLGISALPRVGFLDIGRQHRRIVDGFDPCVQSMETVVSGLSGITTFPYNMAKTDGDLYLNFTFPGQGAALQAASTSITLGLGDPNGSTGGASFVSFSSPVNPNFYANYYGGGGVANQSANQNNWVSGDINIIVSVVGSHLLVLCNGVIVHDKQVVRYAGPFVPRISLTNPPGSPSMTINTLAIGKNRRVPPALNLLEAYGPLAGTGNGINHGTSRSLASIDKHYLQRLSFAAPLEFPGRLHTAAGAATLLRDETFLGINKGTGAATVVNLPANPIPFKRYLVVDVKADAATNNITLTPASGNINGSATNVINTNRGYRWILHDTTEWKIVGSA